jgi:GTPase Era involved in 16S rRNA processing
MRSKIPTFAVIGKPNNGKSSLISALTFKDEIGVSAETGTTVVSEIYHYIYKDNILCSFFDTPGFESAKTIWAFIKKNEERREEDILKDFISSQYSNKNLSKDIEILKAILESDFLIFMINISENVNINTIGNQLRIIKFINKPKLVAFNKIGTKDYSNEWRKILKEYNLTTIVDINPLTANFNNTAILYEKLKKVTSTNDERKALDKVISINKEHIKINKVRSANIISKMLQEILQLKYKYKNKKIKEKLTDEDKVNILNIYRNKIYEIENIAKKKVGEIWGYKEVKIIDYREEIDSNANSELGIAKNGIVGFSAVGGAIIGAIGATGTTAGIGATAASIGAACTAGVGATSTATGVGAACTTTSIGLAGTVASIGTIGIASGAISFLLVGGLTYAGMKKYFPNREIIHQIDKNNYDVTFIVLKRSLEHLNKIIEHGHANRQDVIILKDSKTWKFNSEWSFQKDEIKAIKKIHTELVKDKNSHEHRGNLAQIIKNIIDREI